MFMNCYIGFLIAGLIFFGTITSGAHVCDRQCVKNASPMTCRYNFTVEEYLVMSKACYDCPRNRSNCDLPHCIAGNGVRRIVASVNRQIPGPTIAVCKNDIIEVTMINRDGTNLASTIHWHGQNQRGTPYMDGVPFVTQCPVLSLNNFRYTFTAADVGTYFWHSHIGFQRTDGFTGPLIVRQPKVDEPNGGQYDFDMSEHYIMVSDWINKTGEHMYYEMYNSAEFYGPYLTTFLVNGRGRVEPFNPEENLEVPSQVFRVQRGSRHRFRICSAASFMCPVQVSIDNHKLIVIGADGDAVQPMEVDSVVLAAGERFDVVVNANQPVRNYWIKFHGLVMCNETFGRAILRYNGAVNTSPNGVLTVANTRRNGSVLNAVNFQGGSSAVSLLKLVSRSPSDATLKPNADRKIFLPFDLYYKGSPEFFDPKYYPFLGINPIYRHLAPMLNDIAYFPPPSPLLSQYHEVPKDILCNIETTKQNCSDDLVFCACVHLIKIKLNDVVELFLIDSARWAEGNSHPFHLHGHHFRVIAIGANASTTQQVRELDQRGKIYRNLNNPVVKDTVSIPSQGYTVVRFHATNPGFWLFHCHAEVHSDGGMTLVFQVGETWEMPPVPDQFPKCGHYPRSTWS